MGEKLILETYDFNANIIKPGDKVKLKNSKVYWYIANRVGRIKKIKLTNVRHFGCVDNRGESETTQKIYVDFECQEGLYSVKAKDVIKFVE